VADAPALRAVADDERGPDIDHAGDHLSTQRELRFPDGTVTPLKATIQRALEIRDANPGAKLYARHARRSTVTSYGAWAEVIVPASPVAVEGSEPTPATSDTRASRGDGDVRC
jgi:hypothetical protein